MAIRSIFYGWWVVAAFSFMTCISTGIRHAVGPFLKPIVADLGLDRASFSLVIALSLFLYGVFGPLVGLALDRFGARLTASVGTLVLVLSLVLTAFVRNYWDFAVVYGVLLPLGLAVTGPVMASGVVARWFSARRGTALSLLGSASMTGMSLLVPLVTWLILTTGWRTTYVLIAVGVLVGMLPISLWVIRESPESMGLAADGATPSAKATEAVARERVSAITAMQTLAFWQLAGSFFTCGFSMSLLSAHGIPMLTDHGYSPMFASWTFGVLGGSSMGCTVMLGALSDRFGRRPVLAAIYAGRVLIFAGFFLIRDNPAAILIVAVLGGITMAGTGAMTSALTADIWGRFSVSPVLGVIFLVHQTGSAIGSWLAGAIFEATGGYGAAFALACLLLMAAAIVALKIDRGSRRYGRATALELARMGATIVVAEFDAANGQRTADEVAKLGRPSLAIATDVTRRADLDALVRRTQERFGRIDVLVNNAGIYRAAATLDVTEEHWDAIMTINAKAVFFATQAVLPTMIAQHRGNIVSLASMAGKIGSRTNLPYNVSKAAVISMTKSLALAHAADGIRANCVCPGFVETDMWDKVSRDQGALLGMSPAEFTKARLNSVPLGRMETPEDVANVIGFLASPKSAYMTGQAPAWTAAS